MTTIHRVLDEQPCESLSAYLLAGGGDALRIARGSAPEVTLSALERSGLRGRGGAGFPTAAKWRSVMRNSSDSTPTAVVINGAEGEPSTFKDRSILRNNPYRVLEGALIACVVLGAEELVVCMKESFVREWGRVMDALDEVIAEGWTSRLRLRLVAGPDAYLLGEETALLEVVEGRQPFPRITAPWLRGLDDPAALDARPAAAGAAVLTETHSAPALVNNVETFANVALIVRNGPVWFRELGTSASPGTLVCTVVGDVRRSGVAEFAMGTPLRSVIEEITGGAAEERRLLAVLPGASSAVIGENLFDTPLTHEDFKAIGSGLGSAGFRCIDDAADTFALTHSVSRFLSIESCGQCTPCKEDGLSITSLLVQLMEPTVPDDVERDLKERLATVANQARCSLAAQQQNVIGSMLKLCATAPVPPRLPGTPIERGVEALLVPLLDIVDGIAVYDVEHQRKQPDWTFDTTDSGKFPAQRLQGQPLEVAPVADRRAVHARAK